MFVFLDILFLVFHTAVCLFNTFGWVWRRTRRANLVVLLLTGASWFGLGLWYGIGYCPCTHWHWMVRARLGDADLPNSYMKFLIDRVTGLDVNAALVDAGVVVVFFLSLVLSIVLNILDRRAARKSSVEE
jgi:hypothetical protein